MPSVGALEISFTEGLRSSPQVQALVLPDVLHDLNDLQSQHVLTQMISLLVKSSSDIMSGFSQFSHRGRFAEDMIRHSSSLKTQTHVLHSTPPSSRGGCFRYMPQALQKASSSRPKRRDTVLLCISDLRTVPVRLTHLEDLQIIPQVAFLT
ncbi:hypothetical protein EYF80_051691 [Liparis tanakae]|uniref:Uncharacterized protein n=1 Tax=Liparis tanakae TaxID=230148 RepID=A0A4Z2FBK9_9TELE|nr:hypothetical protein EYF80_051691 [Liparis tanakae]